MVTYIFRSIQLALFSSVVSYDNKFDLINNKSKLSYMGGYAMGATTAVLRISSQSLFCGITYRMPQTGNLHTDEL